MNQNNRFASDMVFTLSEDNDFRPAPAPQTPALRDNDWERNLNALRSRQETDHANERASFPDITITPPSEREHNLRDLSDIYPNTNELRPFGDKELDAAYREYLSQSVAEHNRRDSITDTEVDVLIQEDWLAAQTALQSERACCPPFRQPESRCARCAARYCRACVRIARLALHPPRARDFRARIDARHPR